MVYNTKNYWGFDLSPSSGTLITGEQNLQELEFFSQSVKERNTYLIRYFRKSQSKSLNNSCLC
jgi:hypothetical protein